MRSLGGSSAVVPCCRAGATTLSLYSEDIQRSHWIPSESLQQQWTIMMERDEDLPDLYRDVEWEDCCQEEHHDGRDGVEEDAGGPEEEEDGGLTQGEVRVSQQGDQAGHHNKHLAAHHTCVSSIIIRYHHQISFNLTDTCMVCSHSRPVDQRRLDSKESVHLDPGGEDSQWFIINMISTCMMTRSARQNCLAKMPSTTTHQLSVSEPARPKLRSLSQKH